MTQDEADKEIGGIVRASLTKSMQDGAGREMDIAIDIAGFGVVLARVHVDIADKYI